MIRPLPLQSGDAVAVVAPSSQLRSEQQRLAEQAFQILEDDWGLQVAYTPELPVHICIWQVLIKNGCRISATTRR